MKKEGIQTRNRKLSSKSKKKKAGGCLGLGGVMGDMIKASGHLDLDNKPFHSGFGSPMGESSLSSLGNGRIYPSLPVSRRTFHFDPRERRIPPRLRVTNKVDKSKRKPRVDFLAVTEICPSAVTVKLFIYLFRFIDHSSSVLGILETRSN